MLNRNKAPLLAGAVIAIFSGVAVFAATTGSAPWAAYLSDNSDGRNWSGFGRTYGEQHFSPLTQINDSNVAGLGLAWFKDLPPGNSVTGPLVVDGVLYFTTGYSVVNAVDARTGEELWVFDPKAPEASGHKLRQGWGSRGIAWWNGKIYTGTQDGRLIAIDAKTGKQVWSSMTMGKDDKRFISGPPRAFDGKIIIGHGGADVAAIRGYVTTYDAETGKQLWRFHTVPGNPADGFENKAMEMAAKTWAGEWWKHGGGGTVWNSFSYDAETDTVFLGTGNGSPWNHKIRSDGKGDNLFLCSIIALDAKTGEYKWHYQINPGESWDFNSSMDMELADITIDGQPRKVLMTAPKNGYFYVIDRITGKLISADNYVPATWASRIDTETGRPVEAPGIRYEGARASFSPTSIGAHSWMPMSFSPQTGLVYIPAIELEATYWDTGITSENWERKPGMALDYATYVDIALPKGSETQSALVAWNPVTQKPAWRVPTPSHTNGGTVATAGNLVFHGRVDGDFVAHDARTGKQLWSFNADAPVLAPPISYEVNGEQYVTVLSGMGTSAAFLGPLLAKYNIDYRHQPRRVLTFKLGGKATLPKTEPYVRTAFEDQDYKADAAAEARGMAHYNDYCLVCHGFQVVGGGVAPDLRTSSLVLEEESFAPVVNKGLLVPHGMPRFEELDRKARDDIRTYIRARAAELRATPPQAAGK
ncbi:PQQ-dependent dehydrogenase, methanol/ethanol family [Polymorphobacter sp.]|uniref:PQQ-dependent dehydrogenase, methanol/ethanol family n=1 Tax=Polymorphobacter sp. TaxID=1909290 RepID=UPI003F6EBFAA